MMKMAAKLSVDSIGRLQGPASISYNELWPCPNGQWSGMVVPKGIMGVVMHTMVGNLPGTIAVFNDPSWQASAHFGMDQNGHIHQFGPVNGWMAWAQGDGNPNWYSIELADDGNPDNPLTDAQLTASAQIVEALSAYGVFALQEANSPGEEGYGVHYMFGQAGGGHTCPDLPPRHVRSAQRPEILRRARAIRDGKHPSQTTVVTDGTLGLAALAKKHEIYPATMLRATAEASATGQYVTALAIYVNTVFATDAVTMPDNVVLHYQEEWSSGKWRNYSWETGHARHPQDPQPLHSLAHLLGTDSESIVRLTAEKNSDGRFAKAEFDYINGVFLRSTVLLPPGITLYF
jgi:N-acetylmuramoyl-L-alanine amidase